MEKTWKILKNLFQTD